MRPIRSGVALVALLLAVAPGRADAQGRVTVGVAGGGSIGRGAGPGLGGRDYHALLAAAVAPGRSPVAVRLDALLVGWSSHAGPLSLTANAVLPRRPAAALTPYVIGGWGVYGLGSVRRATGWNAGLGLRARAGRATLFGEARRHGPYTRDAVSVGLAF